MPKFLTLHKRADTLQTAVAIFTDHSKESPQGN